MSWGGSGNALININQLDPKYQTLVADTTKSAPNPFFGVAAAGPYATQANLSIGQLLRPFPEFANVYMQQSTGAHSQYNAGIFQVRKRVTGLWGGSFSYTLSRLNDNQFGESNYYSNAPGLQNNYTVIPGSPYYNPDQEYGRSLLDSPHKIVMAPTLLVPLGEGHKMASSGIANVLLGGWSITPVVTLQAGFPIGISQNQPTQSFLYGNGIRPNIVPGQDFLVSGDITDRITANTTDNLYSEQGGVHDRADQHVRQRAAHPAGRDVAVAQQRRPGRRQERAHRRRHVGLDPPRGAEHVQHRAVGRARNAGSLVRQFRVRTNHHAGEQHAHGAVHAAVPVLKRR